MARRSPIPSAAISSTMAMFISAPETIAGAYLRPSRRSVRCQRILEQVRDLISQRTNAVAFVEVPITSDRIAEGLTFVCGRRCSGEGDDSCVGGCSSQLGDDLAQVVGVSEVHVRDDGVRSKGGAHLASVPEALGFPDDKQA